MSHVRRLAIGTAFMIAVLTLGLILDVVLGTIASDVAPHFSVDSGPFSLIWGQTMGIADLMVPVMGTGVVLWIIWGAIQEERQEEARTRVRTR